MIKSMTKKMNNKKGFTLIELIVVIAILGILAAIAIPRLGGFTADAKEKALTASIRTVEGAAAMYHAEEGAFPGNVSDLVTEYLTENPFTTDPTFDAATGKVDNDPALILNP